MQSLLKHMFVELVMSSNHLILRRPLLLLRSIFPSIRVFSNEYILCIRGPKYWNFSFNISPSNEYSGLIFLRIDWLDLLVVQGTLKGLLQCHGSKASVLWEGERPPKTCHWKIETEFCSNSLFPFGSNHIINLVQVEDWSKERELGTSNHISWAFATSSETANFSWDTAWEWGRGDSWHWSLPLISVKKF